MVSYKGIPRPLKYVGYALPVTGPIVVYLETKRATGSRREAWNAALLWGIINTIGYTTLGSMVRYLYLEYK